MRYGVGPPLLHGSTRALYGGAPLCAVGAVCGWLRGRVEMHVTNWKVDFLVGESLLIRAGSCC